MDSEENHNQSTHKNHKKEHDGNHHQNHKNNDAGEHNHHENESHDHHNHKNHDHTEHHRQMIKDFRMRFWISLVVTLPILALSPLIQNALGYNFEFGFSKYLLFVLSAFIYFYGGWPFITGLADEFKKKQPGMMTLDCSSNYRGFWIQYSNNIWS